MKLLGIDSKDGRIAAISMGIRLVDDDVVLDSPEC